MTELYISSLSDYLGAIEDLKTYYPTGIVFSETSKNQDPQTVENQGFAGLPFSE